MDGIVSDALEAFEEAESKADDILEEALDEFDEAVEAEAEDRAEALDDIRFARLGEQWPDQIRRNREKDNRPILTINRLPAFMRQIINDGRQNRPSIKVRPADSSGDPLTAQILSGLIRNIEQVSSADVAYDTGLEGAVGNGFGYWRVGIDYAADDSFETELRIRRIANPFSVYRDPESKEADSSDWNCAFVTEILCDDDFERHFKGAEKADWKSDYSDLRQGWRESDGVRIAEYWKRSIVKGEIVQLSNGQIVEAEVLKAQQAIYEGLGISVTGTRTVQRHEVYQYILSGAEVLRKTKWPGMYIPIVPCYGDEVNVDGKRTFRSLIRDAKDPQRMFNYWRTVATELVALAPKAPFIGAKGAFKSSPGKWATANTDAHAFLEYDPVPGEAPPQRQPFAGVPAGALQEALNSSDDMKAIMGLYDASLGARSNETSGVAIDARKREGDVSNFHFLDNLSRAIRHTGRVLIDLIPHVYSGERMVRVLGPDDTPHNVKVNGPTQMPNGAEHVFDLAAGKYDLIVEAGPSYTTKRQEAAYQMTEFLRAFPQAAPVIGDLVAKNLDWPGADEIGQRLKALLPPQLQGQGDPRIQQLMQQLQQGAQAYSALQAEAQRLKDANAIKSREADIKAYSAETDRLQAVSGAVTPEQVQAIVMQTLAQVLNSPDVAPPAMPQQMPMQPQ